ncbi:hypothetical protein IWQ56_006528, partial [Coemansia nantahalensis]
PQPQLPTERQPPRVRHLVPARGQAVCAARDGRRADCGRDGKGPVLHAAGGPAVQHGAARRRGDALPREARQARQAHHRAARGHQHAAAHSGHQGQDRHADQRALVDVLDAGAGPPGRAHELPDQHADAVLPAAVDGGAQPDPDRGRAVVRLQLLHQRRHAGQQDLNRDKDGCRRVGDDRLGGLFHSAGGVRSAEHGAPRVQPHCAAGGGGAGADGEQPLGDDGHPGADDDVRDAHGGAVPEPARVDPEHRAQDGQRLEQRGVRQEQQLGRAQLDAHGVHRSAVAR